ncbi:uncharacterized protein LOC123688930 [Harmonia axyridis]|uniref:uncharacterized protein LOC123688930 n=1 Tax=Harmonia axyridis TaxID=115357 RepID=UPI001E279B03|nr:uncharacterized protein LOC123688930 [Harmonia axyridis]
MHYFNFPTWQKLILICAFIRDIQGESRNVMSLVKQYNTTIQDDINLSDDGNNKTEIHTNFDFILKIQFILDANKIIPYLRDEVYENHEQYNITVQDFVDLWNLTDYTMRDLMELAEISNIQFNSNSLRQLLDVADLTFSDYYTEIKKNINNTQLMDMLQILNIDVAKFSAAITFGSESNIYDALKPGIYTWDRFEEVYNRTGLDLPTLSKNLILNRIVTRNIKNLIQKIPIFDKIMFRKVWDKMNITTYDIYRVVNLRRIVDHIHETLQKNIILGVAISDHEVIMHERKLDNFMEFLNISGIYGESSTSHNIYDNMTLITTQMRNVVGLWSNDSISVKTEIMDRVSNDSISSCFYINNDMTENNVTVANITQDNVSVIVDKDTQFNLGNPLVCDGKLLGLARNVTADNAFIFDTFFKSATDLSNSSRRLGMNFFTVLCILLFSLLF